MPGFLAAIGRDVRLGLRTLRKTPAFTAGALTTVALAVGATTAVFSVVYGVLLRQLPYRDVDRVFWIWSDQSGRGRAPFNVPDFIDMRDGAHTLRGFAGYFATSANLSDEAAAERVAGIRATGNFFDVIGASATLGRVLSSADETPAADHVVILTEPFWRRRFGADPNVVGRSIRLDGESYAVVGVLAPGFVLPIRDVEFALPFAADRDPRRGARNSLNFIMAAGRLADGVSRAHATSELTSVARRLQQQFPVENARKRGVLVAALIDDVVGPFRTALLTIFAAVGAVLLIASANLANLMLTRATNRRRDVAVQLSLGASRAIVVRQVVVEALLIGAAGGAVGVATARPMATGLLALAPTDLPRGGQIAIDGTVLLFCVGVSLLTALLFGVAPAYASAGVDVRDALQENSRGVIGGGRRLRDLLIGAEVALAVTLVIVMTLLAKSFAHVQAVAPGFATMQVLSARLTLPAKRFASREAIVTFQRALAQRLRAVSTVSAAGAINIVPLSGLQWRVPFTVEGQPVVREHVPTAQYRTATAGYFEAAGIALKRGRTFTGDDTDRTRAVAVVNESLANRWLAGRDPVGARLLVDDNDGAARPVEVIGVVADVRQLSLDGESTWDLYLAYPQIHADNVATATNMFWVVRTAGEPMTLAAPLIKEVRRIDPDVAVASVRPMSGYLSDSMAPRRFSVQLMFAFGVAAIALATTGVYAVTAYSVSQRASEIALRVALGATRPAIVRLIVGQGSLSMTAGVGAGLALAVGVARLVASALVGVAALDVATFGEVAATVAACAFVACAIPAIRMARRARL